MFPAECEAGMVRLLFIVEHEKLAIVIQMVHSWGRL